MDYKPKFNATAFLAGYLRKSQAPNGMLVGYLQGPTKTKYVKVWHRNPAIKETMMRN